MVNPFALSLIIALKSISAAEAKDFGTHGVIYPIAEEDPIALIQNKLKEMEETGELAQHNQKLQTHAKGVVERPLPVTGITKATESRVFYYDPSYGVPQDLRDHTGRVFAKKGTKINPLETVSLSAELLFFDGDDEDQVDWIKAQLQERAVKPKLVLTKGAPLTLSEELNIPVYFDQSGFLAKKLGIKCVPVLISQEGYFLRIEEIPFARKEK